MNLFVIYCWNDKYALMYLKQIAVLCNILFNMYCWIRSTSKKNIHPILNIFIHSYLSFQQYIASFIFQQVIWLLSGLKYHLNGSAIWLSSVLWYYDGFIPIKLQSNQLSYGIMMDSFQWCQQTTASMIPYIASTVWIAVVCI